MSGFSECFGLGPNPPPNVINRIYIIELTILFTYCANKEKRKHKYRFCCHRESKSDLKLKPNAINLSN